MNTQNTTTQSPAPAESAPEYSGTASYCPEDNCIRLYVGRVPRDEYLKLRAEGWRSTPKQDCDFVATWTPSRRDTALDYASLIEDEDQTPEERAADRAERFGDYRDKRTSEATGHADRYDSGPSAHGYQSAARAERSARRHNRIADRAGDAWSKAEYWQRRTAGVIGHALYKSTPGVRMGRIKTIEADLRRMNPGGEWHTHLTLRLAYENQMLEAQGGRAAFVEMQVGGWLGKHQIRKVNKSNATGRVVSVTLKMMGNRWGNESKPGEYYLRAFNIERLPSDAYTPPTEEDKTALNATKQAEKEAAPKKDACPLVNPTDEDAERLQAIWNAASEGKRWDSETPTVLRLTQAQYSANSKGAHARAAAKDIAEGGLEPKSVYGRALEPAVCKVRANYRRVIILTDKPQKRLPAEAFNSPRAAQLAIVQDSIEELQEINKLLRGSMANTRELLTDEQRELLRLARLVGYAYEDSLSQRGMTDKAVAFIREKQHEKPILAALINASESFALEAE